MAIYPQPKGRPAKLEKADRTAQRVSRDEAESKKVKARSGGRCEMWVTTTAAEQVLHFAATGTHPGTIVRCKRRAVHVHHLLGGFGIRGRGDSADACRKLNLCQKCHSDVHSHVLVRQGGLTPHYQDCYERVK